MGRKIQTRKKESEKLIQVAKKTEDDTFLQRLHGLIRVTGNTLGISFLDEGGIIISDRKKLVEIIESDDNPDSELLTNTLSSLYKKLRDNNFKRDGVLSINGVTVYRNPLFIKGPASPPLPPPSSSSSSSCSVPLYPESPISSSSCSSPSPPPPPPPPPPPSSSSSSSCSITSPLDHVDYKDIVLLMDTLQKEEEMRIKGESSNDEAHQKFNVNLAKLKELMTGFHIQYLQLKERNLIEEDKDYVFAFVIGGPGSGKTTLSRSLADKYGFYHIDVGQVQDDPLLHDGTLKVPHIQNVMNHSANKRLLVDGFPLDEAELSAFKDVIGLEPVIYLYLDVSLKTMKDRLTGHDTAVADARLEHHFEVGMSFINKMRSEGFLSEIDGNGTKEAVFEAAKAFDECLR